MPAMLDSVGRPVVRLECIEKLLGSGWQAAGQISGSLSTNVIAESRLIGRATAGKVINADMKAGASCQGKQPFNGLGFYLHLFERLLLFQATPIRTIPVSVIVQCAPMLTGYTPMGNFVEGTGKKTVGKHYPGKSVWLAGRQVLRFVTAPDQNGPEGFPEQVVEQHDKIVWIVIHRLAIVRL